jgi:ribosomal protein S18 acetylase RimI-like enzyme
VASSHRIRLLTLEDTLAWAQRRHEALTAHPLLFGSAPPTDAASLVEFVRTQIVRDESGVWGAYESDGLDGIVGTFREPGPKERHKASIWGMSVAPETRRRGVGLALLTAAVEHARQWVGVEQVHLSVSEAPGSARALYERAGFVAWGREPRALRWNGSYVDETHMVLDLRTRTSG